MRIVALMTIRNEELYLHRSLEHLKRQGIDVCLIDNGSTDASLEIARSFLGKGVIRIEHLPHNGVFELVKVLENEERLAGEIDADWFIHHDADEIREAPLPYKTLSEGIIDADAKGFNAINFDEFVFLPTNDEESFEGHDYVKDMHYYYFFEPHPLRRVNAWKNIGIPIDLKASGGHRVDYNGINIFPDNFILRHYIALSKDHIIKKYGTRIFSSYEVNELHWHGKRVDIKPDKIMFPDKKEFCHFDLVCWDKSKPKKQHSFFGLCDWLMNELVSVIIPAYNSCNMLSRALESVKLQTYSNWEIIVVDDGSTDGTREFLESQKDSLRFISQQNLGAGPARNAGVKIARGDYIAFLDADDEWLPEKLELQINAARKIKEFGIISTGWLKIAEKHVTKIGCEESAELVTYDFYDNCRDYCCLTSSVLIPKSIFFKMGGFDPQWWSAEDADLWMKIAYRHPVYHLPAPLVKRYILTNSLLRRNLLSNHANRLLSREQWWPDLPATLDVDRKVNKEKYRAIFAGVFAVCFDYFLEMHEFKIAFAAWRRYRRILKDNFEYGWKFIKKIFVHFAQKKPRHDENVAEILSALSNK